MCGEPTKIRTSLEGLVNVLTYGTNLTLVNNGNTASTGLTETLDINHANNLNLHGDCMSIMDGGHPEVTNSNNMASKGCPKSSRTFNLDRSYS